MSTASVQTQVEGSPTPVSVPLNMKESFAHLGKVILFNSFIVYMYCKKAYTYIYTLVL